jgi:hypothetical protein
MIPSRNCNQYIRKTGSLLALFLKQGYSGKFNLAKHAHEDHLVIRNEAKLLQDK